MPIDLSENVPLASRTTLGVGGNARYFADFSDASDLAAALSLADDRGLPLFLLGGGSNVVISDVGFPGVVLHPTALPLDKIDIRREGGDTVELTVGAGVEWDAFVAYCVQRNLAGIECLAGIPGLTGGTPVQNVGAYGQEVSETIRAVDAYDRRSGRTVRIPASECGFAYRRSRFNHDEPGRWIILSVTFVLQADHLPTLKYADVQNYFGEGTNPTLPDVYHGVRMIRARKGMVLDPVDPDARSAGSFFKNPTVTSTEFIHLQEQAAGQAIASLPQYPQPDGTVKLSAAFLIEKAGLKRGQTFCEGRVALSSKHVLALTNRGGATGEDIAAAACEIQARVEDIWGITLAPEPVFVGFTDPDVLPQRATVAV